MKRKSLALILVFVLAMAGCSSDDTSDTNKGGNASGDNNGAGNTETSIEYGLTDNIQDGTILQVWCWDFETIKDNMSTIAYAGFTTIQTVPINSCIGDPANMELGGPGMWYNHYQPTDWKIGNYQVGTRDGFIEMCKEADKYGIAHDRIFIDPLVEMLCTSEDGIAVLLEVIRYTKEHYPKAHIACAISNISFNLPYRKIINLAFAVMAINAGMDAAVMDPLNRDLRGAIYATEALKGDDYYCMEYISAFREGIFGPVKEQ